MTSIQYHKVMVGFCRQRAQMEGEDVSFWLEQAANHEQLIIAEERLNGLAASKFSERRSIH
jgi:hypothetical protein